MINILIADDEPIELMVVEKTLKKNFPDRIAIHKAVNGREAVAVFEEKKCDIALLDIEMPGVNGLDAAAAIRKNNKRACIIFLTAFDEFNYAKRGYEVRALDYLLKPVNSKELVNVIEEAIAITQEEKHIVEDKYKNDNNDLMEDVSVEQIKLNAVAQTIKDYIENNYKNDISLFDVASSLNYSEAYFCKIFKQCFEKSFIVYLMEFRVEKAKELLEDVVVNIKDVSNEVGYRDANYFAKVFKRVVGFTPSEYRIMALKKKVQ